MEYQKEISKIILLGNSQKFYDTFSNIFKDKLIIIVSWRNCDKYLRNKVDKSPDLIVICGYDYCSGLMKFDKFIKTNIVNPISFIDKIASPKTILLYMDTNDSKHQITYSRYRYAKNALSLRLLKYGNQYKRVKLPVILNNQNSADVNGNLLTKFIFNVLIRLKVIDTINLKELKKIIIEALDSELIFQPQILNGRFLKIRRTLFIDRVLRLIYG